ncbi:DNA polymerase beta domain protein region [Ignisphaera aggregans DSM 17230]|uniref:DNA polymerase beta domain protein region n=1 Tax=Ignisphaera aggregans (strain DSM 17230 / JCM 13409 / AQ1.S1) TaxID=583356 RepID=E0SS09_IGNAA|nr:DNA polymerase beta domain protein region [Ignisphaera aggregans DSM 17230]
MLSWVRYHFEHLRRWREYAEKICSSIKSLGLEAEVYVIGGVAEDRITVLSDIDILIVVENIDPSTKKKLAIDIMEKAIDSYGLPWDAPIELHIIDRNDMKTYFRLSKTIKIC